MDCVWTSPDGDQLHQKLKLQYCSISAVICSRMRWNENLQEFCWWEDMPNSSFRISETKYNKHSRWRIYLGQCQNDANTWAFFVRAVLFGCLLCNISWKPCNLYCRRLMIYLKKHRQVRNLLLSCCGITIVGRMYCYVWMNVNYLR